MHESDRGNEAELYRRVRDAVPFCHVAVAEGRDGSTVKGVEGSCDVRGVVSSGS